jgi:hypothetical protein
MYVPDSYLKQPRETTAREQPCAITQPAATLRRSTWQHALRVRKPVTLTIDPAASDNAFERSLNESLFL